MSAPLGLSSGLPALLAAAGLGVAAAETWRWMTATAPAKTAQPTDARNTPNASNALAVPSSGGVSSSQSASGRRPSTSYSGARFEGSVSRLGSEASYLEEREYEGDRSRERLEDQCEHDQEHALGHSRARAGSGAEDDEEPSIYMCPHCQNYINSHELIVPSLDEAGVIDDDAETTLERQTTARILSAAEQLSIQLALKESLYKIFQSVDEDADGIITREEMGIFLKKLGLTGEREQAFLNIVGGDSLQNLPAPTTAKEPESASSQSPAPQKRMSDSSTSKSSPSGQAVTGINFRQFLDRFQDTLEGMEQAEADLEDEAEPQSDDGLPTTSVSLDPQASFESVASNSSAAASFPAPAPAASQSQEPEPSSTHEPTILLTRPPSTDSTAFNPSTLLTPPRPTTSSTASHNLHSGRLTVNTLSTPGAHHRSVHSGVFASPVTQLFSPTGTGASAAAAAASSPAIRVFLGGACGDTTWRKQEAIPQFQSAGITFYDPQVKEWSSKLVALEGLMKAWCKILFFVIGAKTRALASMIEVAALIAAGRRVVLVIEPVEAGVEIEGQVPSASELKDLNRAREYLRDIAASYNIPVHASADAGIKAIIAAEEEEKRELRARILAMREHPRGSISSAQRRGRGSIMSTNASLLPYTSPQPNGTGGGGNTTGGAGHSAKKSFGGGVGSSFGGTHPPPQFGHTREPSTALAITSVAESNNDVLTPTQPATKATAPSAAPVSWTPSAAPAAAASEADPTLVADSTSTPAVTGASSQQQSQQPPSQPQTTTNPTPTKPNKKQKNRK